MLMPLRELIQALLGTIFLQLKEKLWNRELIRFDLFIAIPEGYYGRIVGRSGLANVHGITVYNGTIDSDSQGIVCVVLFNLSNEGYVVETSLNDATLRSLRKSMNLKRRKLKEDRRFWFFRCLM